MAISKRLMSALRQRDGDVCAWSGMQSDTLVPHHRANRGAGGFEGADRLSNLILVDSVVNQRFENDLQRRAQLLGFKISRYDDPEARSLFHKVHGWVLLKDDGTMEILNVD